LLLAAARPLACLLLAAAWPLLAAALPLACLLLAASRQLHLPVAGHRLVPYLLVAGRRSPAIFMLLAVARPLACLLLAAFGPLLFSLPSSTADQR